MEQSVSQLRLAAIVAIDVAGYSARAAADEAGAVAEIAALGARVAQACARFGGRVFNTAGDGFMLEFPTVSGAIGAAEDLAGTAGAPIRIGVHVGEVHVSPTGDLLGHGVNVAARIQARAAPGSVLVSADVKRAIRGALAARLTERGLVRLDAPGETVPVFALDGGACRDDAQPAAKRGAPARRGKMLALSIGASAIALVAVAGLALVLRPGPARPQEVALAPFQAQGGEAARAVASELSYELAGRLANTGVKVVGPDARGGGAAGLVLHGRLIAEGRNLRLVTELEGARDRAVLWSASFTGAADQPAGLEQEATTKLSDVLHCALDAANFPDGRIDAQTLQIYLRACDLDHDEGALDQVRDLYRQVAARQPGFSRPWSRLAYASALAAFSMQPAQARAARQEARAAAQRSLRINPKDGLAYEALGDAGLGELSWAQIYGLFERGLAVDPNSPTLIQDEAQLLLRTGRVADAVTLSERGVAIDPFSPEQRRTLVEALLDGGHIGEARAALERALRSWPQDQGLLRDRIALEVRYGDTSAQKLLAEARLHPAGLSDARLASLERLARARSGGAAARRAYVHQELADFEAGRLPADSVIMDLSNVGATDAAFGVAATVKSNAPLSSPGGDLDPEVLWRSFAEPMRRDPRFIGLAAKLGLVGFWRTTGMWPDFCSAPSRPYDCRAATAGVEQGGRSQ